MADCSNCPYLERIERIERQYDELRKESGGYGVAIGKLETKMDTVIDGIDFLKAQVTTLSALPAQRWNTVIVTIITGIVSALVASGMALLLVR